jgi:hypothetical protein
MTTVNDIRYLLKEKKLDVAIMMTLACGTIEQEITADEMSYCYADLTLIDNGAHWNTLKTIQ